MLQKKLATSLTQKLYRADQVRLHEKQAAEQMGVDMYSLMKGAGASVFEHSVSMFPSIDNYLVLVGSGHNAGDGYIAALNAFNAGKNVTLCAVDPHKNLSGDVARAKEEWIGAGGQVHTFSAQLLDINDIVIDALLGIGIDGVVRKEFASLIEAVNQADLPVISIDVPSGLDATTGNSLSECIQATATITFIGVKTGLCTGSGKQACGQLIFEDLGVGKAFSEIAYSETSALDLNHFKRLAPRPIHSHKGNYGRLLCIGGNKGMSGAIRLSAEAALRTGAGLVKVFTHRESIIQISNGRPELMVSSDGLDEMLKWSTCIVIGPGLGQDDWSQHTFDTVMTHLQSTPKPIVFDAEALTLVALYPKDSEMSECVITPHSGEAARLLQVEVEAIESDRLQHARRCAQHYAATCVLKGPGSVVSNQQHSWICRHGNPGMATAGMGDVLAGIIGAFMAQGLGKDLAAQYGVALHAKAGDIIAQNFGQRGIVASDLFNTVRQLINEK